MHQSWVQHGAAVRNSLLRSNPARARRDGLAAARAFEECQALHQGNKALEYLGDAVLRLALSQAGSPVSAPLREGAAAPPAPHPPPPDAAPPRPPRHR